MSSSRGGRSGGRGGKGRGNAGRGRGRGRGTPGRGTGRVEGGLKPVGPQERPKLEMAPLEKPNPETVRGRKEPRDHGHTSDGASLSPSSSTSSPRVDKCSPRTGNPSPRPSLTSSCSSSPGSAACSSSPGSAASRTTSASSGAGPSSSTPFEFQYRDPPVRPGVGTLGRSISLRANHFPIKFPDKGEVYHYDVTIKPDTFPRRINRQVVKEIEKEYSSVLEGILLAYDGAKSIYTSKPLPSSPIELSVQLKLEKEKPKDFKVLIKHAGIIPLRVLREKTAQLSEVQPAIQALDIVLRNLPSMRFETVGRSFFMPPGEHGHPLGYGREVWTGYYQSVRPSMWTVTLNLDISNTAFYKEQDVLDFLVEIICDGSKGGGGGGGRGGRGGGRGGGGRYNDDRRQEPPAPPPYLTDAQRRQFAKEIKGLKVQVTHLPYPRKYKVKDVTQKPSKFLEFDCEGRQVSVAEYFRTKYGKALYYPDLPCLHMEGKTPHIYIPMEFCKVIGQKCNRKLTADQTSAMIRHTAKPAYQREKDIKEKFRFADFGNDKYLRDFGIKVAKEMSEVTGRVLDPPSILCKGREEVQPENGSWDRDMREKSFCNGISVDKWGILFSTRGFDYHSFASMLSKVSNKKGMRMNARPTVFYEFKSRSDDFEKVLRGKFLGLVDIVVVVLDGRQGPTYSEVKRIGDNRVGLITQCIHFRNASNPRLDTLANICLKINSKLGGTNSVPMPRHSMFPWRADEPFIIFGADVTHPAPGDKKSPSLAAITASMDRNTMDYRVKVKVLGHRQEVFKIDQLAELVKEMLRNFFYETRVKPYHIIFYRDGVSEGQFKEVILNEVAAIQKACIDLEKGYKPGITFLVVQKRHHTRLFCANREDQVGKGGNVPPGTTVDTVITHPREFDFFLCSHAGIQGTSKPAHYHVLWDDNGFSSDQLQSLTFQLCHCYVRCNRSVSYPAPTYYSHLAAFRARYTLQDWEEKSSGYQSDTASSLSYSSADLLSNVSEMEEAIKVSESLKNTMYFV